MGVAPFLVCKSLKEKKRRERKRKRGRLIFFLVLSSSLRLLVHFFPFFFQTLNNSIENNFAEVRAHPSRSSFFLSRARGDRRGRAGARFGARGGRRRAEAGGEGGEQGSVREGIAEKKRKARLFFFSAAAARSRHSAPSPLSSQLARASSGERAAPVQRTCKAGRRRESAWAEGGGAGARED